MITTNEQWEQHVCTGEDKRERYYRELQEYHTETLIRQEHEHYLQQVHDAGFDDAEEYEAYWKRLSTYFNNNLNDGI